MHQCIKFILFGMTLYMFRTVFPSMFRSSRLYIQQQAYVKHLASRQQYLFDSCMYSLELLMMHGKTVGNMQSVIPNKINLILWCILLVLLQKYNTKHGPMNVKGIYISTCNWQYYWIRPVIPVTYRLHSRCIPVAYRLHSCCIPVAYPLHSGSIPVAYRQHTGSIPHKKLFLFSNISFKKFRSLNT